MFSCDASHGTVLKVGKQIMEMTQERNYIFLFRLVCGDVLDSSCVLDLPSLTANIYILLSWCAPMNTETALLPVYAALSSCAFLVP